MAKRLFNIDSHNLILNKKQLQRWILGIKEKIAQWIINDNEVDCDKLDVKGLDVKEVHSQLTSKKL